MQRPRPRSHRLLVGAAALAVVSALAGGLPSPASAAAGPLAPLVTLPEVTPLSSAQSDAVRRALEVAEASPERYSGAWWDPRSGTAVLGMSDPAGGGAARSALAARGAAGTRLQPARHSSRDLFTLSDAVVTSTRRWANVIDGVGLDPSGDRVLVHLNTVTGPAADRLRRHLMRTYGSSVAVTRSPGRFRVANRTTDSSPFYGGGRSGTAGPGTATTAVLGSQCTSGFAWRIGLLAYMVTAGHCYPDGTTKPWSWTYTGDKATAAPAFRIGLRAASSIGTNGDTKKVGTASYYGDIALINVYQYGADVSGELFHGNAVTTVHIPVAGRSTTFPAIGDQYCTSGSTTGTICGWSVTATAQTIVDTDKDTVRYVWIGHHASGACIAGGDSGGAVYIVNSAGKAVGRGIISSVRDSILPGCDMAFTPLQYAETYLGGALDTN